MRMVVVLPLPLAPRNPQISPAATCSVEPVDDAARAEALAQVVDVDDEVGHGAAAPGAGRTVDRLAGIEQRAPDPAAGAPRP